ncbi:MAG: YceI family protein [Pseudomonadota bacterium]
MNRRALILALPALAIRPAKAAPEPYTLDAKNSRVAFIFVVGGQGVRGTMPVASARIALDLANIASSSVATTLDPTRARTGFALATDAMTGPGILDVERHPKITFRSTAIQVSGLGGQMEGDLTIRGVTRPVTLGASLYRRTGIDDQNNLTVQISGEISRAAFGASAFSDLVADSVTLDILARVTRAA